MRQGLALFATLLSACSFAPKYEKPSTPDVAAFKEVGDWTPAAPADSQPRGAWWEAFNDGQLNQLEQTIGDANQDLRGAVARYDQARALARTARSNLFPIVDVNASASRGRNSANAPNAAGRSSVGNNYVAAGDLNWELDLFGRLRDTARAANERARAGAADVASLDLLLRAELATDYFSLRGADATAQLLENAVKVYDRALELTKNRYEGGIAAATDVDQAETQRQVARAQLASVRLQRAQLEHAIAVLLGQPPSTFSLEPAANFASEPPALDTGLPSTLLLRRPDVASAERRVAAANDEIGVARAAWFPIFSIGASGGYQASDSHAWFDAPSKFWSVGPAMTVPFLDAGGRISLNRRARAAYEESVANYRQTALVAYQEVEDNLAAIHYLSDALAADQAAAASAERSVYHANQRYAAGVADYIEVTSTQTTALQAQRAVLDSRVQRLNATVTLVRALGGGWTPDQLEKPVL